MRTLALDVGEKRIGIALSDPMGIVARGLRTLKRTDLPSDLRAVRAVVEETEAAEVLVGLPLDMDGSEGESARRMRIFAKKLEAALEGTDVALRLWDERLSSVEAERILEQRGLDWRAARKKVDQVAAAVFLQEYLDERAAERGGGDAGPRDIER